MSKFIYINPGCGNEPFLLGMRIAQKIRTKLRENGRDPPEILLPEMYGRERRFLEEEGLSEGVSTDADLGKIQREILFRNNDFKAHLIAVNTQQAEIQRVARNYLRTNYPGIIFEINTASRISGGVSPSILVFPAISSEILKRTLQENSLTEQFGKENLERAIVSAEDIERDIDAMFIPLYSAFSFDPSRKPHSKEISTPPLCSPWENHECIPPNSIYCLPSGTGSEVENICKRAIALREQGYSVFVPQWTRLDGFEIRSPKIIANPNIVKVIARAGWGTMWKCQVSGTNFESVSDYTAGDDPEMFFNLRTLREIPMKKATAEARQRFGDLDGIEFVANWIISYINL